MPNFPHEPFLAKELNELGLTRQVLRAAVADGAITQLLRGVYCLSEQATGLDVRLRAARLVLREHVVISDHSAAWLHGVDSYDPASLDLVPPLYVVSLRGHEATRRPGVVAGQRDLAKEDICDLGGLSVTTPLRTAADLGCLRGRAAALAVLDAFMRHHDVSHEDYARILDRFAGRRGVRQLRELVPHASRLAESPGESWTRSAIIDAGLPVPKLQVWVTLEGFGRVRLDLAFPILKIAVEYDGDLWHSTPEQRAGDRRRRDALRAAGWIVLVVRKGDLVGPALDEWLARLRRAIEERRPPTARKYPIPPREPWRGMTAR